VPSGTEDSNAATGTKQVCDAAGNCATAGPITGIKVDRLAPSASFAFSGPRTVLKDSTLRVSYSCVDGGSGVQSCTGDAASGAALDTSTPGIHYFHVTSTDAVGNSATRTATYIVSSSSTPSGPFQVAGTVTDQAGSSTLLAGSTVQACDSGTTTVRGSASAGVGGAYKPVAGDRDVRHQGDAAQRVVVLGVDGGVDRRAKRHRVGLRADRRHDGRANPDPDGDGQRPDHRSQPFRRQPGRSHGV
jgi:hypothetical protein